MSEDSIAAVQRTPVACPLCGHDGAFDGLGRETQKFHIIDSGGVESEVTQQRYRFHCGNCDGEFSVVEDEQTEILTECIYCG